MADKKYGTRVYLMDTGTIRIAQTFRRETTDIDPYIIDQNPSGSGEKFVDTTDDKGIADAIRDALAGRL